MEQCSDNCWLRKSRQGASRRESGELTRQPAKRSRKIDRSETPRTMRRSAGGVMRYSDIVIDVMPIVEKVLGFTSRWYRAAVESADTMTIADQSIRMVKPVYFVATTLEAFHGRGADNVTLSHDLEDIVAVIDGRAEIIDEIANAPADVRAYIASEIGGLMSDADFREAIPSFLLPDPASQARRALLEERLNAIAAME